MAFVIRTTSYFPCCAEEPCSDARFEYPSEILAHMREEHPGERLPLSLPTVKVEPEGPPRLRIMHCRFCAVEIETRDPEVGPYCSEHPDPAAIPAAAQPEEIHHHAS